MSTHTLKLLSEAYRNVAIAPTYNYRKTGILEGLEEMIEKEMEDMKKRDKIADTFNSPTPPPRPHMDEEIPF